MITTATGKTVLVTGGSRGIGAAIAIRLAGIGMNLLSTMRQTKTPPTETINTN
jgi:NAD(P)-dependent dehydrogenase (short-subunit alcohol dehydrogenase family)